MYRILLVIQFFSLIVLLAESAYIYFYTSSKLHTYLFLFTFATFIDNLGYYFELKANDIGAAYTGCRVSYLGKVVITLAFIVFILEYLGRFEFRKYYGLAAFFHGLTFFAVLTNDYHKLYYTSVYFEEGELFNHCVMVHGPWYYMYMGVMIVYIAVGTVLLIWEIIKEKNTDHRKRLLIVLLAGSIMSAGMAMYLFGWTSYYDVTNVGYTTCAIILLIALKKYDMMDTMKLAKEYVFDNMSQAVIAVNLSGKITFFNRLAKEIYPEIEKNSEKIVISLKESSLSKAVLNWRDKRFIFEEQPLIQNGIDRGKVYILIDEAEHFRYLEEIREQKEAAEAANKSKSRFLSVVTHEIRTPMNAVVGMTNLLLKDVGSLNEKQKKYLYNIRNSGQSLVMIVNDILDQSKIEAGKMELVNAPYNLRSVADDVKLIIENRVGEKPIDVVCEIASEVPSYIVGDALRIRQIMINLMNNAVKFTEEGSVTLGVAITEQSEGRIRLKFSVKDTGQGIRQQDLNKLWEAFSQVDTERNHSKEGTGLGLSISKDFVGMMGGILKVESVYGKGSEFYFEIWQDIADESLMVEESAESEEKNYNIKVLVVDDTPINLMIAEEVLTTMGVSVDTSTSGTRALQMVKRFKYDFVFMDYRMPNMDGVELTKEIRALEKGYRVMGENEMAEYIRKLPIIALTGDTSDEAYEAFMVAGASGFTDKPINPEQVQKIFESPTLRC